MGEIKQGSIRKYRADAFYHSAVDGMVKVLNDTDIKPEELIEMAELAIHIYYERMARKQRCT